MKMLLKGKLPRLKKASFFYYRWP